MEAFGEGAGVFIRVLQNGRARGLGEVTAAATLVVKINKYFQLRSIH